VTMQASIAAARVNGPSPQAGGTASIEFKFAATDPVFAGHFPKQPLLPGIFQLEMARLGAEWLLGRRLSLREICKAKFLRPIIPAELIRMNLKLSEHEDELGARAIFSVGGQAAGETILKLRKQNDF
jgi:3-hydroxymyristoyl/3-hydroxydecanoyl-(acyl carrier protein) dehydratase